jgi:hypothetical protein
LRLIRIEVLIALNSTDNCRERITSERIIRLYGFESCLFGTDNLTKSLRNKKLFSNQV